MSSVQATTALSLRGTDRRGQRQEIARQAPGPHLETQVGEHLGGDLIPFHGQSGSRVFPSLLRVALGAAPHPACKHGACSWSCPSSVAQRDAPAQSQPSCDCWETLWHLHHVSASELKLLWIPLLLRDLPWGPTLLGASHHSLHPHPFTSALGTTLRTLWWQNGRRCLGGGKYCEWEGCSSMV